VLNLDNLIQIAHNVEIGENTVIAAQTGVAGSTKIGKNCMIGGQVGIVGHIQIADGVKIAAQSGIGSSVLILPEKFLQGISGISPLEITNAPMCLFPQTTGTREKKYPNCKKNVSRN
jgi:UDP-3-O-[3-hydroxymyristoyl] glucosamine N-acyltransferase